MAKRKTRKQKILADQRHILYHLETPARLASESFAGRPSAQVSLPTEKKAKIELPSFEIPQTQTHALPSYAYVVSDIKKTAFITFSIIIAQIILFIILHRV